MMKTFTLKTEYDIIKMPKLTFGAGMFDAMNKAEEYKNLLDIYHKHGGNCIDTARIYCSWVKGGADVSETITGQWIEERHLRDKVIVSTKGGHPPLENMHKNRLNKENLNFDLNKSLDLLKTDYVDLYFLHRDDESMDVSEIMPTLHEFVKKGRVRFLGASNWKANRIQEANKFAVKNRLTPFSISQINFSLAHTTPAMCGDDTLVCMNDEEYGWYLKNRFPVMCFCSQAKGFFSKYLAGSGLNQKINNRFVTEQNIKRAERVKELCEKHNVTPAAVALAYLTCNPLNLTAIMSFSSKEQLYDSLGETRLNLTPEEIEYLKNGD